MRILQEKLKMEVTSLKHAKEIENNGEYDFLIIGSGSAAFASAIKAKEYGAKVGMIESGTVGGTCVNIGCVPSKTLLKAGEINSLAKENPYYGLRTSAQKADLPLLVSQKDALVNELRQKKYIDLIDEYGIELIQGEATFINENTLEVNGKQISANRFLIATGASPVVPPIEGLDKIEYLTSTSLLNLKEIPNRLTVIGSGFIALELGQLFHHLGSKVTLIQRSKRLLNNYDPEISVSIEQAMSENGIAFLKGVQYERVEQHGQIMKVHLVVNGDKKIVESEQILIATGRRPNTDRLNLNVAGVETGAQGEVKIDEYAQTTNEKIYAAGDVTNGPQFVYVAAYEGGVVADNALGELKKKLDLTAVPNVIFTNPSVASVGLTEKQAIEEGYEVKTSVLQMDAVTRALVNFETTGVIKLVADTKSSKILGVHMVAENAGEVIYAATLAVKYGLTIEDLTNSMAPYLTMAEGLKLAALTFDRDVSKLSCCAI